MPRKPREKSRSGIYHVMLRGINRQTIFEEDEDKWKFLDIIKYYKDISKYQAYSYCLMDNHVHLLIKENQETISTAIKRIGSSYVYWYNDKYERCGHLFQDRFRSEVVESEAYFLTVLRYIHQNPVNAGIVEHVSQSRWTSYQEYMGKYHMVDIGFALDLFDATNRQKALTLFVQYMNEKNDEKCLDYEEKWGLSDAELIEYIYNKMRIANINELQRLEKNKRDNTIKRLKNIDGVTIRQLSRITGISKSVIGRI